MSKDATEQKSVHVVLQRYRSCRVLLDEKDWINVGSEKEHCGLLAYVSFSDTTDQTAIRQAAQTLVQIPVLTTGLWGDGVSKPCNLLDLAAKHENAASVVLVPQANLISKVKSLGKSIQYHGQVSKVVGEQFFRYFNDCVRGHILEGQLRHSGNPTPPSWYSDWKQKHEKKQSGAADPSIPPEDLFRDPCKYSAWNNETGIPSHDVQGQPLSKSAMKKLVKTKDAHTKRHQRWKEEVSSNIVESTRSEENVESHQHIEQATWSEVLDESYCHVVTGSFGMRQGLELKSDMGPFCHIFKV